MSNKIRDARISFPIIIGSYARLLSTSPDGQPLYEWVIAVKSAENPLLDLSPLLSSVEFTLHPSFPNPKRLVKSAPFAVTEQGWGEFDISIKISFRDYKSVLTSHLLRLYSPTPQPVVTNERLDALAFTGDFCLPPMTQTIAFQAEDLLAVAFGACTAFLEVQALEAAVVQDLTKDLDACKANMRSLTDEIKRLEEIFLNKHLDST